jgi:hypothetical protein
MNCKRGGRDPGSVGALTSDRSHVPPGTQLAEPDVSDSEIRAPLGFQAGLRPVAGVPLAEFRARNSQRS